MILNRSLLVFVAVLLVVLQSTMANVVTIQGAKIEMLPAFIVYCAMSTSLLTSLIVAFSGGLLQDVLSAGRLGLSALPLCGIAIILTTIRPLVFRDFFVIQILMGSAAALFTSVWMVLCQLIAVGHSTVNQSTVATIFWVVLASGVLTPLLFLVLDRLIRLIGHKPGKVDLN
ncbi:MAG: rod shape-determining protein MreD [Verrucomicrobiae bacterium]|nr:rod shape-determining protein MreD [Verrucomicrobiae bacterium]